MKIFKHTWQEGVFAGLGIGVFMAVFPPVFVQILNVSGVLQESPISFLESIDIFGAVGVIAGIVFFLAFLNSSRNAVTVGNGFIHVLRDGKPVEERKIASYVRFSQSLVGPMYVMEFSDEPNLIIPRMGPFKLRALKNYVERSKR